jgi:polyferredoxin
MYDKLKNRRRMAYISLIGSAIWYMQVFWVDVLLEDWGAAVVTAYLGVPGMLAGLQLWKYLRACDASDSD